MNKLLVMVLVILNLPFFGALASMLFGRQGVSGAVRFLFTPELISAFRGELWEDIWSELMFGLWVALCVVLVWSEYNYIEENHPGLFAYFVSVWPK